MGAGCGCGGEELGSPGGELWPGPLPSAPEELLPEVSPLPSSSPRMTVEPSSCVVSAGGSAGGGLTGAGVGAGGGATRGGGGGPGAGGPGGGAPPGGPGGGGGGGVARGE